VQGRLRPKSPTALVERLTAAADAGRTDAELALTSHYAASAALDERTRAMGMALDSYRAAAAKPTMILRQREAARIVEKLAAQGMAFTGTADEKAAMERDFPLTGKSWNLDVEVRCRDGKDHPYRLVIWSWARDYPPTDPQIEGLDEDYGCSVHADVANALHRLFATSREKNIDFVDLVYSELDPMGKVMASMKKGDGVIQAPVSAGN
jgi:hypothetical protein